MHISRLIRSFPRWCDLLALIAGLCLPLAFSPFDYAFVAPLLMTVIFGLWFYSSPGRAFFRGWLFGFGMFLTGVYWVYNSMHVFGHVPVPAAIALTVLLAGILGIYPAIAGWLCTKYSVSNWPMRLLLVFPAIWVLIEWLRGWFLTGFPWLNIGYSQVDTPLAGLSSFLGVYGISWAVALTAGLMAMVILERGKTRFIYLGGVLLLWGLSWQLGIMEWTQVNGNPLRVALVQGNVDQAVKWHPAERKKIMQRYLDATHSLQDVDIVIWPETSIPAYYQTVADNFLIDLEKEAQQKDIELLVGLPVYDEKDQQYFNSMLSVGNVTGFYHKRHLVPFGEYIPLKSVFKNLLDILNVPMSDFSEGLDSQTPVRLKNYATSISICYEIAFGEEVIQFLPAAAFLVNVSNNAWFGDSSAPHQILQMARMRAMETERDVLVATNNGVTAIVNYHGIATNIAPQFEQHVLKGEIQPRSGATLYVQTGNYPIILLLSLILFLIFMIQRRRGE